MPPPFQTTADAVDRETAWLNTTWNDGLPILPADNGGKWDLIQAYEQRTPALRKNQIWVTRAPGFDIDRFGNIRSIARYRFELKLYWTLSSGQGDAQNDQRLFDAAIHDVVMRVRGIPPGVTATNPTGQPDKTHNANFMSVAENPSLISVRPLPVEATIAQAFFAASVTYLADDWDFND